MGKKSDSKAEPKAEAKTRYKWGRPVVDATESLRVALIPADIENGRPADFGACAIANALARTFGCEKMEVCRTKAWVLLQDENGDERVERFDLPERARDVVVANDLQQPVGCGMVVLKPPRPSERLGSESKKRRGKKSQAKRKAQKAAADAGKGPALPPKGAGPKPTVVARVVRSGTGRIHTHKGPVSSKVS